MAERTIDLGDLRVPYTDTHDATDGRWYQIAGTVVCAHCNGTGRDEFMDTGECQSCWEEQAARDFPHLPERSTPLGRKLDVLDCEECANEFAADTGWAMGDERCAEFRCGECFAHHDLRVAVHTALHEAIPSGRDRHDVIEGVVALVERGWRVEAA